MYESFRLRLIVLIIFSFILCPAFGDEVVGSRKIVIEESVTTFSPVYTYEFLLGPNQTPYTLSRGMFMIDFLVYSQGSLTTKLYVGLWDFLTIGISEDMQGVIGNSEVFLGIPLVTLKLNILNELNGFSLSVAIDNYSCGTSGKAFSPDYYSKVLYGIHIPMAVRYKSLFNSYSDIVFGVKFPLLPVGDVSFKNTSLFLSSYLKVSDMLTISFGIDNLFLSAERLTNSSVFAQIKLSPTRALGVSLLLNNSFLPYFERMVRIEYLGNLF
ncbi:MAG: hypothetical protein ABDH28_06105 [Brevinematia bacterium]